VENIVYNKLGCGVTVNVKCNIPMYLVTYLLNLSFTLSYVHCWGATGAKLGDELGVKVGALKTWVHGSEPIWVTVVPEWMEVVDVGDSVGSVGGLSAGC